MTNANDKRVKASLERTRLRLKAEGLELERRRRDYLLERDEAIAALRVLCERYGDNDWGDELPLREVLEAHLAAPLADRLAGVGHRMRALERQVDAALRAAATVPATVPPRPIPPARPAGGHDFAIQASTLRGQAGHRAVCTCTWRSPLELTEAMASLSGRRHVEREATRTPRGVTTRA